MAVTPAGGTPPDAVAAYRGLTGRRWLLASGLFVVALACVAADLLLGPSGLTPSELFATVFSPAAADVSTRVIVWDIRLPQAAMATMVGAALGLAGAEMQTILNNPLASPYTLGVSSAAALGASLAIVLQAGLPGLPLDWLVPVNAFLFAALCGLLLDAVARRRGIGTASIVLFGVALVFSFNALTSLIQFVASAQALQNLVFWTMGSMTRANWSSVGIMALALAVALPLAQAQAWRLTALRLGEERAASFGVDVRRVRLGVIARVSVLSALAVAFVGTIGFVGLVAPHIARRLFGEDHRYFLPGSALTGALILSAASLLSKNLLDGVIVPVGILTALVGVPFFLAVLLRRPASL